MKQRIEPSMKLLITRFNQLLQQYEQILQQQQPPSKTLKDCERQLAYLVRVCINLFSYGMPSATSKRALDGYKRKNRVKESDEFLTIEQMALQEDIEKEAKNLKA
jgi:hypothetical protein